MCKHIRVLERDLRRNPPFLLRDNSQHTLGQVPGFSPRPFQTGAPKVRKKHRHVPRHYFQVRQSKGPHPFAMAKPPVIRYQIPYKRCVPPLVNSTLGGPPLHAIRRRGDCLAASHSRFSQPSPPPRPIKAKTSQPRLGQGTQVIYTDLGPFHALIRRKRSHQFRVPAKEVIESPLRPETIPLCLKSSPHRGTGCHVVHAPE